MLRSDSCRVSTSYSLSQKISLTTPSRRLFGVRRSRQCWDWRFAPILPLCLHCVFVHNKLIVEGWAHPIDHHLFKFDLDVASVRWVRFDLELSVNCRADNVCRGFLSNGRSPECVYSLHPSCRANRGEFLLVDSLRVRCVLYTSILRQTHGTCKSRSSFIAQTNKTTQPANVQPSSKFRTNMATRRRFFRPTIAGRKYSARRTAQTVGIRRSVTIPPCKLGFS